MTEMAEYNFHMGVHYMDLFRDDADTKDVVEAVRVLSEFFADNVLGENVDPSKACLASKAIDVAYAALAHPFDAEDGKDLQTCVDELRTELGYYL